MTYRIAGIDVHKKMLAVVVADIAREGEYQFEQRRFGATAEQLRQLTAWLIEQQVEEVVMESTAQYWRPVWETLERYWRPVCLRKENVRAQSGKLHLAQAQSNRGPRGRKNDWRDAERLVRRLVAGELVLSFVPDPEQRLWRTVTHRKQQLNAGARTSAQSSGSAAGTGAHQVIQPGFRPAGGQRTAHVAGPGGRGNRSGATGRAR